MLNEVGQCPHTQIALKCLEFHRVKWLSIVSGSTSLNKCFNFGEDLGPAEHASFCINFFTGLAIKKDRLRPSNRHYSNPQKSPDREEISTK